ncbi:hypothetical protein V6N12_068377 [Hibiscus sabdariffa]|uniref:Uncharacterized protein n=1 Tax=Hibiscus sabdariffa TaxID=183260 RepID=A0ABR2FQ10_9ROSI
MMTSSGGSETGFGFGQPGSGLVPGRFDRGGGDGGWKSPPAAREVHARPSGAEKRSKRRQSIQNQPKTPKPNLPWRGATPNAAEGRETASFGDSPARVEMATNGRCKGRVLTALARGSHRWPQHDERASDGRRNVQKQWASDEPLGWDFAANGGAVGRVDGGVCSGDDGGSNGGGGEAHRRRLPGWTRW